MWARISALFGKNRDLTLEPAIDVTALEIQRVTYVPDPVLMAQLTDTMPRETLIKSITIPTLASISLPTSPVPQVNYFDRINFQRELDAQHALSLDKKYEFIYGVSRHPQAEATSSLETENLGPEPELQPPVPPINFSNLSERSWMQEIITVQLDIPRFVPPAPSMEENNRLYHPNPNNEPTKAWVLYGFNPDLVRQAQNNIDRDKSEKKNGVKKWGQVSK